MKIHSIIAILALTILFSCQKNTSSESNYHVSFTVDGKAVNYTGYVGATFDTASGYIDLTALGANSSTSYDNYFGFYLDNYSGAKSITTGQYVDASTDFTLLGNYTIGGVEYDAGQTVATDAITNNVTIANHFKVNITSLDRNTIKGTFSGDFFKNGDMSNISKVSITNGDFYLKLQ